MSKVSVEIILQKKGGEKILCLTAYTFSVAKILDEYCDMILVGDSVGMAIYGMPNTIGVDLEMMINHGKAVMRAAKKSLVVIDLPFGTYEKSKEQALKSAQKVISETGCDAIKIEVTADLIETIKFLVENKINVVGHVGLLPQHIEEIGGYRYQGRDENSAREILETAKLIEKAGAFALVIEAVPADLATKITEEISIPTIGIGASASCDGQVLVIDDLIGLNQEFKPRFVTRYENIAEKISRAVAEFAADVKSKKFPAKENII